MTDEARKAAESLYNRINREDRGSIATVGVAKTERDNEILIVYVNYGYNPTLPTKFDKFVVLSSSAENLQKVEEPAY